MRNAPPARLLFVLLLLALPLAAQMPPPSPGQAPPALPAAPTLGEAELALRLEAIIRQPNADRALWGLEIYSLARGRTLYALNPDRYFTPASVTKLFTTAAALALLRPDYRFHTLAGGRARIDSHGRLTGHLYLVGGGDPDLSGCDLPYVVEPPKPAETNKPKCDPAAVLDDLAAQVADKGVKAVAGDLVIDQWHFAPEPYPTDWTLGDIVWSYGAPVRALSLVDNTLTLQVAPGDVVGARAVVTRQPFTRFYDLQNATWTSPPGTPTQLYVRRDPGSRVVELRGAIALDDKRETLHLAIEEPSEFVGELFLDALGRRGIQVEGRIDVRYAPGPPFSGEPAVVLPVLLAEHTSRPLADDVTLINKVSQNLHAEMLLRSLGRLEPPQTPAPTAPRPPSDYPPRIADGSTEAGLEVLRAWLAGAGINPDDAALVDGSGLSRRSLVTPHAVVQLLVYAQKQPWGGLFRDSLPVAGVDGTLRDRMKGSPAEGRLRAKTGSLGRANALAGYVETKAGETLVFAIFLNHHTLDDKRALELIDQLAAALTDLPTEK